MNLSQAHRLAQMALEMSEQPDLTSTLEQILANAQGTLRGDAAGVLCSGDGGSAHTAAVTDERVRQADALQRSLGEGPWWSLAGGAAVSGDTVSVSDTRSAEHFPRWAHAVADLGFLSVLSIRLRTPVSSVGNLNVYASSPDAFTAADLELAQIFGWHASVALTSAQNGDSLRAAIDSRHVIGQAQGILMERYQVDADRAFEVLRRYSQHKNIKLRTIAEQVITQHRLPD